MWNSNNNNSSQEEVCKMTIKTNDVVIETKRLSESNANSPEPGKTSKGKKPRVKLVPVLIPVIEDEDSNSDELSETHDKSKIILPNIGSVTLETPKNVDDLSTFKPITDPDSQFSAINVLHESPVENSASSSLKFSPQSNSFYLMSKSGLSKSKVTLPPGMTLPNFSMSNQASPGASQNLKVSPIVPLKAKSNKSEFQNRLPNQSLSEGNLQSDSNNSVIESFNKRFRKILPNTSGLIEENYFNSFQSIVGSKLVQTPQEQFGNVKKNVPRHVGPKFITIKKVHDTSEHGNNVAVTLQPTIVNVLPATSEESRSSEPVTAENVACHQNVTAINNSEIQILPPENHSSSTMKENGSRNQIIRSEGTSRKPKNTNAMFLEDTDLYKQIEKSRSDLSVRVTRSYSRKEPVVSKIVAVQSGETIGLTDPCVLPNTYFVNLSHGTDSNSAVISNFTPKLSKNVPDNQTLVDCPLCIYKVTSNGKLKKHMKIHHLIDNMQKFSSYLEILKKRQNISSFTAEEMKGHHKALKDILSFKSNKPKMNNVTDIKPSKSKPTLSKTSKPIQRTFRTLPKSIPRVEKDNTDIAQPNSLPSVSQASIPLQGTLPTLPYAEKDNFDISQSKYLPSTSQTSNSIRRTLNNIRPATAFLNRPRYILPATLNRPRSILPATLNRTKKKFYNTNDPVLIKLSKRLGVLKSSEKNQTSRSSSNVPSNTNAATSSCKDKLPVISIRNEQDIVDFEYLDGSISNPGSIVDTELEKNEVFETDYSISDDTDSECDYTGDVIEEKVEKPSKPRYTDLSPDSYFCTRCYFITKDIKEFADHREIHNPPFICPYCRIVTYGRVQLKLHMQSVHDTNAKWNAQNDLILSETNNNSEEIPEPVVVKENECKQSTDFITVEYHCQACGFYSVNYPEYLEHVKADHVKSCNCSYCGKVFDHELKMVEHLKFCTLEDKYKHTSEKIHRKDSGPYNCYICFNVFNDKKGYIAHLAKKHNALRYFCVFCNTGFYKRTDLKGHYKGNHLLGCRRCKLEFNNTIDLWVHRNTHENNQRFVCEECGKVMRNRAYFRDHLNFHRGIKTHTCKFCGEKFSIYDALATHRQQKHADEITTSYLCNFCGIQFKFRNRLCQHVRVVHETNTPRQLELDPTTGKTRVRRRVRDPRTGDLVERSDLLKSNLRPTRRVKDPVTGKLIFNSNHKPIVMNKRKRTFLCRHCGIQFSRMADLREHKEIHELPSDFQCDGCGLYFASQMNLNTHAKMRYCSVFGEKKRVRPPRKKVKLSEDDFDSSNTITSAPSTTTQNDQNVKNHNVSSSILRVHIGSINISPKDSQPIQQREANMSRYTSTPTIIRHIRSPKKAFLAASSTQTSKPAHAGILDNEIAFAVDSVLEHQNINVANNSSVYNNLQTGPQTGPQTVSNYIIVSEATEEEFPALNFYTEFA